MVVSVGLTAVTFLTICTTTLVYRPQRIYVEIFLVPIGIILSFTFIRANLPGAPAGFGKIHILEKSGELIGLARDKHWFLNYYESTFFN